MQFTKNRTSNFRQKHKIFEFLKEKVSMNITLTMKLHIYAVI